MRLTRGATTLLILALAVALPLAGCGKKPLNTDVTTNPGGGGNNGAGGNGNSNGSGADNPGGSDKGGSMSQDELSKIVQDIFFEYDDATLSAAARDILSTNASHLAELTQLRLLIEGHCDERGTVEYNLALGQRRADATKSYLVSLGVDGGRLATRSLGEERPFASGSDESAWSQNRRAHFVVANP